MKYMIIKSICKLFLDQHCREDWKLDFMYHKLGYDLLLVSVFKGADAT